MFVVGWETKGESRLSFLPVLDCVGAVWWGWGGEQEGRLWRKGGLCYRAEHADSFLLPPHSSLQPSSWVFMKLPAALRLGTTNRVSWFTPKWWAAAVSVRCLVSCPSWKSSWPLLASWMCKMWSSWNSAHWKLMDSLTCWCAAGCGLFWLWKNKSVPVPGTVLGQHTWPHPLSRQPTGAWDSWRLFFLSLLS